MKKDFQKWHEKKRDIHDTRPRIFFKEREIWFCHLGENIGFEQDGSGEEFLRPVIALKKFNNEVLWVVPLTKTIKDHPYYFPVSFRQGETGSAILSQIRLIDGKRLKYKIGNMSKEVFGALKAQIRQLLA